MTDQRQTVQLFGEEFIVESGRLPPDVKVEMLIEMKAVMLEYVEEKADVRRQRVGVQEEAEND